MRLSKKTGERGCLAGLAEGLWRFWDRFMTQPGPEGR